MKKILIAVIILAVIAVAAWMAYPLFVNKEVNESLDDFISTMDSEEPTDSEDSTSPEDDNQPTVISSGTFEGRAGHAGTGTVNLIKSGSQTLLQFEGDFDITNGPDLFVHLGTGDEYSKEAQIEKLKGNRGEQIYVIPDSINVEDFDEVWVWCRAFSVPFVKATLAPVEDSAAE